MNTLQSLAKLPSTGKNNIGSPAMIAALISGILTSTSSVQANQSPVNHPVCASSTSDIDGDGWGWENDRSCEVVSNLSSIIAPPTAAATGSTSLCIDTDGDGWGWNGTRSCQDFPGSSSQASSTTIVSIPPSQSTLPQCSNNTSDSDGDGWGYEHGRSCLIGNTNSSSSQTSQSNSRDVKRIDEMALVAGQSNAVATGTPIAYRHDSKRNGLHAFQSYRKWMDSDQCNQDLHPEINNLPGYPANLTDPHRQKICNASMAVEIGEGLLNRNPNSQIGVVSTGSPGMSITHWDDGTSAYNNLVSHASAALNASEASNVDTLHISWHQGEADHGQDKQWYKNKLYNLIQRLTRDLSVKVVFIGNSSPFIPEDSTDADPYARSMNSVYEDLANDGNPNTCYVDLSDLARRDVAHFTASSIQTAGRTRIAELIHRIIHGNQDGRCD